MLNIIDKYKQWETYSLTLNENEKNYYEIIFKCAKERKGIIVVNQLEFPRKIGELKELRIIHKFINSIIFYKEISSMDSQLQKEKFFDMFELESRILCEYLKKSL